MKQLRYLTSELDGFAESTCRRRAVKSMRKPMSVAGITLLCHERSNTVNASEHKQAVTFENLCWN